MYWTVSRTCCVCRAISKEAAGKVIPTDILMNQRQSSWEDLLDATSRLCEVKLSLRDRGVERIRESPLLPQIDWEYFAKAKLASISCSYQPGRKIIELTSHDNNSPLSKMLEGCKGRTEHREGRSDQSEKRTRKAHRKTWRRTRWF